MAVALAACPEPASNDDGGTNADLDDQSASDDGDGEGIGADDDDSSAGDETADMTDIQDDTAETPEDLDETDISDEVQDDIADETDTSDEAQDDVVDETDTADEAQDDVVDETDTADEAQDDVVDETDTSDEAQDDVVDETDTADEAQDDVVDETDTADEAQDDVVDETDVSDEVQDDVADETDTSDEVQDDVADATDTADEAQDDVADETDTSDEVQDDVADATDTADDVPDDVADATDTADDVQDDVADETDISDEVQDDVADEADTSDEIQDDVADETDTSDEVQDDVVDDITDIGDDDVELVFCYGGWALSANNIDELKDCDEIEGNLTITTSEALDASFPKLKSIGGTLYINSSSVTALAFDALETIGGDFETQSLHVDNTFPVLSSIDGDLAVQNVDDEGASISFDALEFLGGELDVRSSSGLASFSATSLAAIGGNLELFNLSNTTLMLPELTSVGGNLLVSSLPWTDASGLPAIESVAGDLIVSNNTSLESFEMTSLTNIGGLYSVDYFNSALQSVSFPNLSQLGDEDETGTHNFSVPSTVTNLSIPQLASVNGNIKLEQNSGLTEFALGEALGDLVVDGAIEITYNFGLVTVDLSALTAADRVDVSGNFELEELNMQNLDTVELRVEVLANDDPLFTTLDLSSLSEVGTSEFSSGEVVISGNDYLQSIDLAGLTDIYGDGGTFGWDDDVSVAGKFEISQSPALISLDFTSLVRASTVELVGLNMLGADEVLDLSPIEHLLFIEVRYTGFTGLVTDVTRLYDFDVENNASLGSIIASSLATMEQDLNIEYNPALVELNLESLLYMEGEGSLSISFNNQLCESVPLAIIGQLLDDSYDPAGAVGNKSGC